MNMHGQETITRYLQDAEAAERNFESVLASFSKMGDQPPVQTALASMSRIARTQHQRLRTRIEALGAESSTAKSALAHAISFAPTIIQLSQTSGEKNTQHLIITIAAAAAETAMYEALATAAGAAGDTATERLARELQDEERQDYTEASALLRNSAVDSFRRAAGEKQNTAKMIQTYLEDAIAAEKSFETQLRDFASEGSSNQIHALFSEHANQTRNQYERLTKRLESLGGNPSSAKSFIAHLVGLSPKLAQLGHDVMDRMTQNLMVAFAVENCEIAIYESLVAVSESAGDLQTAELARSIQTEEREMADRVWQRLSPTALSAFDKMAGAEQLNH
jgi:ferritin-like metal-binding protein YciE